MTKKILTAVLALALSVALWMYVVMVIGPEYQDTFRDIPVTFVGEPSSDLMLRNTEGHKVTLTLSGNRSDLNKLSSSNITVTVDLSQITEAGTRGYRYDVSFPGNVAKNAVIVQTQEPASVMLTVDKVTTDNVPVEVVYEGPLPENYVKTQTPEPKPIHIEGPEEIVNQIEYAKVTITSGTVPEDDITGTYPYEFYDKDHKLVEASGITPAQEARTVSVTYPIRVKKEVKLDVDVKYGGGITAENTSYTVSPEVITVFGRQSDLKDLDVLMLGEINFSTMQEDGTIVLDIAEKLKEISEDMSVGSGEKGATVTVDLPEYESVPYPVTRFEIINEPEDIVCTVKTPSITVTVRGSAEALANIKASDIKIIVDCTDAIIGDQYLAVTAVIDDPSLEASVVGNLDNVWVYGEDAAVVAAREAEATKKPVVLPINY